MNNSTIAIFVRNANEIETIILTFQTVLTSKSKIFLFFDNKIFLQNEIIGSIILNEFLWIQNNVTKKTIKKSFC